MPNLSDEELQQLIDGVLASGQSNRADPRIEALSDMLAQRGYAPDVSMMAPGAVIGPESDMASLEGFMTRMGRTPATDSEVGDYYGPGSYANAPFPYQTRDQLRNQEIMFGESDFEKYDDLAEETGDDDFKLDSDRDDGLGSNKPRRQGPPSTPPDEDADIGAMSTDSELDMVRRRINGEKTKPDNPDGRYDDDHENYLDKSGDVQRGLDESNNLSGDEDRDRDYLLGLLEDGEINNFDSLLDEFEEMYGYRPEL